VTPASSLPLATPWKRADIFRSSPFRRITFIARQHVTNILAKQLSVVEVSSKIATASTSLFKQQRTLFLRQQLAAINAELQRLDTGNADLHGTGNGIEDEDETDLLIRVDSLPVGSEVRRAATAEARRLKRIPPQNAEHGVVRTYVCRPIFLSCICSDLLLQLE